jgi:hypothetical protein
VRLLQRFPDHLEEDPLLGIHGQLLARSNTGEGGIEAVQVVDEPTVARDGRARFARLRGVVPPDVEPVFRTSVTASVLSSSNRQNALTPALQEIRIPCLSFPPTCPRLLGDAGQNMSYSPLINCYTESPSVTVPRPCRPLKARAAGQEEDG